MLCKVCRDGLGSIEKLNRLCLVERHVADAGTVSEYWHQPKHQPFLANFWYAYGHHRDEVSFARSAGQLCVMCSDFPFRDDESDRVSKVRKLGFFTIFWISYENGNPSMTVDSGYGLKTVSLVPVKTKSILDDVLNFDLDFSTDSERTWMMISNWMEACSSYHDRCKNQSQGDTYRPARLLEIHYPKCPHPQSPPMFRLVKGDHCPQNTRYVTLSYRWGDKPLENTIRLLKTTCAWLGELNPIGRLPKTFRDAMRIAHRFSIRYLWIDRLCIYQDSVEDWRREAGSVQDVYRNASFCISALSAEDDEGGCFFPRDPSLVAPTAVKLNGDDGTYRVDLEDITWNSTFQDEPLTKRAWVLQERLMAPRTIHFGRRQVFWECSELHACETHPKGFGEFHPSNHFASAQVDGKCDGVGIPLWKQLIATPTIPHTTKDPQARTFTDWSTIITLYSGTKLTVPSDKLVAVSGLAKDVRKRLQCVRPGEHRYLAGLWEDVLMETLLWYVQVGSPARRAADYRAPSWSWASLDGNLIMPDMFLEETIELSSILSTDMEFLGGDDTGEVKGGTLTLYGPVCRVKLSALSDNQYSTEAFRRFDGHVTESSKIDDSWLPVSTVIFDTKDDLGEDIFCIWLIAQPPALRGWQTSGLALQGVGDDMFQRVGTVYSYHMNQAEAENFVEAFVRREIQII
ncbi:HET-domain-containing protein [Hypomontagnella monticulosa]|nr:HET-domain-containing protein [Hypomontagnella monticulosa]